MRTSKAMPHGRVAAGLLRSVLAAKSWADYAITVHGTLFTPNHSAAGLVASQTLAPDPDPYPDLTLTLTLTLKP